MTLTPIVGVHGIWNYGHFRNSSQILSEAAEAVGVQWAGWLAQGLDKGAGIAVPARLPVAYYADCLNLGIPMGVDDPEHLGPFERQIFVELVERLRRAGLPEGSPEPLPLGFPGSRYIVRQPVKWLTENHGALAVRVISALARELGVYFGADHVSRRTGARDRVAAAIRRNRPRVLLAHSLGSVVAYETLFAHPDLSVEVLVTLGSPLGIPGVVFDRLEPRPDGRGARPANVRTWINISDRADPVAIPSGRLGDRFDGVDQDYPEESIHWIDMHLARNYLGCSRLARVLLPLLSPYW